MRLDDVPELGVGVVEFGGLRPLTERAADLIDFVELEPATNSLQSGDTRLQNAPDHKPRVIHGVSCPLGGVCAPSHTELRALSDAVGMVDAPWVSEHLSIDRLSDEHGVVRPTGFFLPPTQTASSVEIAARRTRHLASLTDRPVAFETGVNYFNMRADEMSDGAFFSAVAEEADCMILLDLHNLWCNEHNGRQPVLAVLEAIDLSRVVEVHLAGGQIRGTKMLDAHSGLVSSELMHLAGRVVPQLPNLKALTFELVPDYVGPAGISPEDYRHQLEWLHDLWEVRGSRPSRNVAATRNPLSADASSAQAWERDLADELRGHASGIADPEAIELYRHLIRSVRLGAVVTLLPLTHRYLVLEHGVARTDELLTSYTDSAPSQAWAIDEAIQFSEFVRAESLAPVAVEVSSFELAANRCAAMGHSEMVEFSCEPSRLIEDLARGRRPVGLRQGQYQVRVGA